MKTILSIDGGGIRGLIPALVLAEVERRTRKAACELFDLMAGTSTGGILSLGLALPDEDGKRPKYSAEAFSEIYLKEGKRRRRRALSAHPNIISNALGVV